MTRQTYGKSPVATYSPALIGQPPSPKAGEPALKPFRQGSLDAYCGFYAIANAMLRLEPTWFLQNEDKACDLLAKMMKGATEVSAAELLCREGMDGAQLEEVARVAVRHMKKLGYRFLLSRPDRALPEIRYQPDETAAWLATASTHHSLSVVLHIEERGYNHWSVLKSVEGNRVRLFDSDMMTSTHVERCEPWMVVGVSR